MSNNPENADRAVRAEELAKLVRLAIPRVARQLMVSVPPSKRSEQESWFLRDCIQERRAPSPETLAQLLDIGARAETPHLLSEAIRHIEVGIATSPAAVCVYEESEAEQEADAALDLAQLKLRDQTPVRLQQIVEAGTKAMQRIRRLVDAAALRLARQPKAVA